MRPGQIEVWVEPGLTPPRVLVLACSGHGFEVRDPALDYVVVFSDPSYRAVTAWLTEDEFQRYETSEIAATFEQRCTELIADPAFRSDLLMLFLHAQGTWMEIDDAPEESGLLFAAWIDAPEKKPYDDAFVIFWEPDSDNTCAVPICRPRSMNSRPVS